MAETQDSLEQQVEHIIRAGFAHQQRDEPATNAQDETGAQSVIDVDLYRLEGGAVLLVPNNGTNPLDVNAVESVAPSTDPDPITETPTEPFTTDRHQEE